MEKPTKLEVSLSMYEDRISISPDICSGKPCIAGSRIMVKNILAMLAGGNNNEQILKEYPSLIDDDIKAALEYAMHLTDEVRIFSV